MARVLYPGSFDPVTNGHLDVLQRASRLFDEVIVAVAHHNSKQALLSVAQRVHLLKRSAGHLANVRITSFEGLLVNFAREQGAQALIRGLRAVSDFEFEFQMALMNRSLQPELETLFLMPSEEYTYLSSRMVKEVSRLGGDVRRFVPQCVVEALSDPKSVPCD
jgi:pantetheine-phosphate adenylyltransferase